MLTRSKLLFAVLAAAAMMLTLVAGASARNWRLSETRFEEKFERLTFEAAGNNISCPTTLLGSYIEQTLAKNAGLEANVRHDEPPTSGSPPCTGGSMTILTETLPWRVNYVSFTGTLPRINSVRYSIIGMAYRFRTSGGLTCLVGTTSLRPAFAEAVLGTGGRAEGVRYDETVGIPLGGAFLCELAGEGHFSGTGTLTNLPGNAPLTYTLI